MQVKIVVTAYDEGEDHFVVELPDANGAVHRLLLPAFMLPFFGLKGEPSELIGTHMVPCPF